MSYRVVIPTTVSRRMVAWLPDFLLVEAHMRLREELAREPRNLLRRTTQRVGSPFDGLIYSFSLVDPQDRLVEHFLTFQVVYGQDEQTLVVTNFAYAKLAGI